MKKLLIRLLFFSTVMFLWSGYAIAGTAFDPDNQNRKYDPTDENHVAYYLNNDFYNQLLDKEFVKEYTYSIQPLSSSFDNNYVTCKIAMISKQEFDSYKTRFSTLRTGQSGYSFWTRTAYSPTLNIVYISDYTWTHSGINPSSTWPDVRPTLHLKSGLEVDENNRVVTDGNQSLHSLPYGATFLIIERLPAVVGRRRYW